MKTVITMDAAKISRLAGLFPGPIFDLRPFVDGRLVRVWVGEYVSVLNDHDAPFLRDALRIAKRKRYPLYVIGEEEKWQEVLKWAKVPESDALDEMAGELEVEVQIESA
ncbi:MAG: hypothetical protein AB8I69_24065 [Anaerolineae bacterium]